MEWMGFTIIRTPDLKRNHRVYGVCEFDRGIIRIDSGLTGGEELDTVIHEALHAIDPDMSEVKVMNTARQLTALLTTLKYTNKKGRRR